MSQRPDEQLKETAAELARLLYSRSNDRERMNSLLEKLPTGKIPATQTGNQTAKNTGANLIGIWKPVTREGQACYERDVQKRSEWHLWANVNRFYAQSKKKRIILLGESVARGCLYDPYYTVAMELEAILAGMQTKQATEVIDLAKTSMGIDELRTLTRSCVKLAPAAVVIFAGNNWASGLRDSLTAEDYQTILNIVQRELYQGVKSFLENKFSELVLSFLQEIETVLIKQGIAVIFVIPEFNLKDWKSDDVEKILPWLPGNAVEDWLTARDNAELALANNDWEALESSAGVMVQVDPFNPLGYEWLAHCYINKKQWAEARACCELSRDAVLLRRGNNTNPRCFGVIRKTILSAAEQYGIKLVDLPVIFNNHFPESVPGRHLFLDYCHLTVQGIKIAMQHTAKAVLQLWTGAEISIDTMAMYGVEVPAQVQAVAHFCAAIHNAHYGQPEEIIAYHCEKAVALSPVVQNMMCQYVDFSTRHTSTVLCKTLEEIIIDGNTQQYEGGLGFTHPRGYKLLDFVLVDAMLQALSSAGINIRHKIKTLRKHEHGVGTTKLNLLESFYNYTSYNDSVIEPRPGFVQIRTTKKQFRFVAAENYPVTIELVYRTPGRNYAGRTIKLQINDTGTPVIELPMSSTWIKKVFTINRNLIKEDLNTLTIIWPYTAEPFEIKNRFSPNALLNAMFPVLGEIYSFSIMAVTEFNDTPYPYQPRAIQYSGVR